MKLSLVVLAAGKQEGKVLEIKVPQFLVGRDPQCHLRPNSPMISKRHCALIVKDGKVYLKDFGSTNGSFVNDVQVKNAVQLKNGDKVKVGPLFFEVRLETDAAVSQPATAPAATGAARPTAAGAAAKAAAAGAKSAPVEQQPAKPAASGSKQVAEVKPGQTQLGAKPADSAGAPHPPDSEPVLTNSDPDVDDDIAAMLLSAGSGDETVSDTPAAKDDVPQGTTVFDLPVPGLPEPGQEGEQDKEEKPRKPKEEAPKPQPIAPDSRSAASMILEKMRKRPRNE